MKKTMKWVAWLVTVVLLLQLTAMSAMSVIAVDVETDATALENATGSVTDDGGEIDAPAEEETEMPGEDEPPAAPTVRFVAAQWKSADSQLFMMNDGATVLYNRITVRALFTAAPTTVTATVADVALPCTVEDQFVYMPMELFSGEHTLVITYSDGVETATVEIHFTVLGEDKYPTLGITNPEDLVLGEKRDFVINGANLAEVHTVEITVNLPKQMKVEDVYYADGLVGMYMYYRGTLKLVIEVHDVTALTTDALATVRVQAPDTLPEGEFLFWTVVSTAVTMKENSTVGKGEGFVNKFKTENMTTAFEVAE